MGSNFHQSALIGQVVNCVRGIKEYPRVSKFVDISSYSWD
jgi:hypothetical protein